MNSTIDQPTHWLGASLLEIEAAQRAQLSKGLRQVPANISASDDLPLSPSNAALESHQVTRRVFAIPILHDVSPDTQRCAEGITIDFSQHGVTFELATTQRPAGPRWFLGVEKDDGELGFMTVVSQSVSQIGCGLRVSASLIAPDQDPLAAANLTPAFDPQCFAFQTKLPPLVLDSWVALGVLQVCLLDRVLVCPRCYSLPTFRRGCQACGSINVVSQRLIHHFACAHVDRVDCFEYDSELACPKCRVRNLVVGADFEYLDGPFQCHDCHWSDSELANIARCAACGDEFATGQAAEKEVFGYHADRVEPLDFFPAD